MTESSPTHIVGRRFQLIDDFVNQPINYYSVDEYNLHASNIDFFMLGDMEEEEEMWPLDEFGNGIKCFVLELTEEQQQVEGARYLSMPLIHQKPTRTGPY